MATAIGVPLGGWWSAGLNRLGQIDLHARMPENGGWSVTTLRARVGEPIHLHITSDDVVHGFAIGQSDRPALEIEPGVYVDATLTFDQPGQYTFYCTRWCGPNHWRMRGTIEISGEEPAARPQALALYLQSGIDIDHPAQAEVLPSAEASAARGVQFADRLPSDAANRDAYLAASPAETWLRLRAERSLNDLSDQDLWDAVAWIWQQQSTPEDLAAGQALYVANCAACHGETGRGDGVMVRGRPVWDPDSPAMGAGSVRPPDFTDARILLGASPVLLEGKIIRGGMGTGMPYWGPILTRDQIDALVGYLYRFAWNEPPDK